MTKPLIRLLLPSSHKPLNSTCSEPTTPVSLFSSLLENPLLLENGQGVEEQTIHRPSSLRMLLLKPTHTVHHYWRKFDDKFMRPVFGGRGFVPFVPGSPTERNGGFGEEWNTNIKKNNRILFSQNQTPFSPWMLCYELHRLLMDDAVMAWFVQVC